MNISFIYIFCTKIYMSIVKIFEGNITFMNANETESNTLFSKTCDIKYIKFVNKVLKESADSFEKEQKFLDNVLLNLYNIFGGAFEKALELYEGKRITYIFPSKTVGAPPHSDRNKARYLVQVKGLSGATYTLFPDINYCHCASFSYFCHLLHLFFELVQLVWLESVILNYLMMVNWLIIFNVYQQLYQVINFHILNQL
ncbi:hypothetical protein K0M31_017671 [Melipona bicolor]|uniref:Uncharacterized protein n=1 Tax=Melipona bicolor TaxID=60889 RepID=A0AA40G5B6_9HYME|nr:hypothetical protein K0M31_017671 [Melipona bicolor]